MVTIFEQNGVTDPTATASNNPAFQSGGADTGAIQPGQNVGSSTIPIQQNVVSNPINTNPTGQTPQMTTPSPLTPEQQTAQKYQSALTAVQQTNTPPPTTPGQASGAISNITSGITQQQQQQASQLEQSTNIQSQLKNDPGYQQLIADHNAYLSSQKQQETLVQQYQDLSKQLGLPALNAQLVDMKSVINGTEGDIRNEVTKAGGFATESQVQALASARNKVLIQNYNNLLATRDNAQQQLTTMTGLAEKDRAYAQQQAQDQLNFDKQIMDYTQKFTQNARDALSNMQKTEGWDGIYKAALASGDPQAIQRINQTMGPGFNLAIAAQNDFKTRQAQENLQKSQAQLAQTQATTAKTEAETAALNLKTAQNSGQPNPQFANQPGFDARGIKYTTSTAANEVRQVIKTNGLTGTRNLLAPNDYNYLKSWWVQNGLSDSSFDSVFGGMKDPSLATKHVYN